MNVFKLFGAKTLAFYFYLGGASLLSSITNLSILMMVNKAITKSGSSVFGDYSLVTFIVLIAVSFLVSAFVRKNIASLTNNSLFDLEISIVQRIRASNFDSFIKFGKEKIYSSLSDVKTIGQAPEMIVNTINSSIAFVLPFCYLFWISWKGGIVMLAFITILFLIYRYVKNQNIINQRMVRDNQNRYYTYLNDLINGFKQVKVSTVRSDTLFNEFIYNNRYDLKELNMKLSNDFHLRQSLNTYSWYLLLGFTVFLLPTTLNLERSQTASFITTLLFMMSSVGVLLNNINLYSNIKVSLERLDELNVQLDIESESHDKMNDIRLFESIRFEDVVYNYEHSSFSLDLPSFSINEKEQIFITGSNGSGKSSFMNLFTSLIKPQQGKCFINNVEVDWQEFKEYRNKMSVIYTDHYLFQENYDKLNLSANNPKVEYLINLLNLSNVVNLDVPQSLFSGKLSKGQQKRLFLLFALLEEKPIIVLDEWAAEQDIHNRKAFYTKWLKLINEMGKTLIVITHDDDFLHLAERIVKFGSGKIISDTRNVKEVMAQ